MKKEFKIEKIEVETFRQFTKLINVEGKGKKQIARNWIRRMILQERRESFERWTNVSDNIKNL
jgi:hypothetical protein